MALEAGQVEGGPDEASRRLFQPLMQRASY